MELQKRCEYFLIPTAAKSWFVDVCQICVALKQYQEQQILKSLIRIWPDVIPPGRREVNLMPHRDVRMRGQIVEIYSKNVQVGAILGLRIPVRRLGKMYRMWRFVTGCSFCNASRRCIAEQSALQANKWVTMWDPD